MNGTFVLTLLSVFCLTLILLLNFFQIPDESTRGVVLAGLGVIFGKISTIVDFYFGSSSGSRDKDVFLMQEAGDGGREETNSVAKSGAKSGDKSV